LREVIFIYLLAELVPEEDKDDVESSSRNSHDDAGDAAVLTSVGLPVLVGRNKRGLIPGILPVLADTGLDGSGSNAEDEHDDEEDVGDDADRTTLALTAAELEESKKSTDNTQDGGDEVEGKSRSTIIKSNTNHILSVRLAANIVLGLAGASSVAGVLGKGTVHHGRNTLPGFTR